MPALCIVGQPAASRRGRIIRRRMVPPHVGDAVQAVPGPGRYGDSPARRRGRRARLAGAGVGRQAFRALPADGCAAPARASERGVRHSKRLSLRCLPLRLSADLCALSPKQRSATWSRWHHRAMRAPLDRKRRRMWRSCSRARPSSCRGACTWRPARGAPPPGSVSVMRVDH